MNIKCIKRRLNLIIRLRGGFAVLLSQAENRRTTGYVMLNNTNMGLNPVPP